MNLISNIKCTLRNSTKVLKSALLFPHFKYISQLSQCCMNLIIIYHICFSFSRSEKKDKNLQLFSLEEGSSLKNYLFWCGNNCFLTELLSRHLHSYETKIIHCVFLPLYGDCTGLPYTVGWTRQFLEWKWGKIGYIFEMW